MGLLATKRDLERQLEASEKRKTELEAELRQLRAKTAKTKFTTPTAAASADTGNAAIRAKYAAMAPGLERRAFRLANLETLTGGSEA